MARISDLDRYNSDRYEAIKIKTVDDSTVLMTADDLKAVMIEYLSEEMNFFSDGIVKKDKIKLQERLDFRSVYAIINDWMCRCVTNPIYEP
jgi:hypothetical protein